MLHEKSLLSYLLAVVAMATVGCDDDTVNHDVFTKADGTLICVAHSMPTRPSSKKETSSRSFASSTLNDMNIHVPNSTKTIQNASASNERFAKTTTSTISNARQDGLLARLRMLALNDDRRHDDAEPHRARNGHRHDLAPLRRQNVDLTPALERLKRPYCSQTPHQYADDGA